MLPKIVRLDVRLRDDRLVDQLRVEIAELQAELADLRMKHQRTEFMLTCEYSVNQQLTDYCREHDFQFPKRLFQPGPVVSDSSGF